MRKASFQGAPAPVSSLVSPENTATPETQAEFKSLGNVRQTVADKFTQGYGAEFLNPLVGPSAGATFAKMDDAAALLHFVLSDSRSLDEVKPGLALWVQTLWSAAQYESQVCREIAAHLGDAA